MCQQIRQIVSFTITNMNQQPPLPPHHVEKEEKNTNLDRTGYNGVNTSDASSTAGEP